MVKGYGKSTSTSTLRKHLYTTHIQEWIEGCERLQLKIRSKDALQAIAAHRGVRAESQAQQRPQFTQENFVNALAEFIIATDQVYLIWSLFCLNLAHNVCL
jgi:hypothetical protein